MHPNLARGGRNCTTQAREHDLALQVLRTGEALHDRGGSDAEPSNAVRAGHVYTVVAQQDTVSGTLHDFRIGFGEPAHVEARAGVDDAGEGAALHGDDMVAPVEEG